MLHFMAVTTAKYLRARSKELDPLRAVESRHRAFPRYCDQNRHVNNAHYLTFGEYARAEWFGATGVGRISIERSYGFLVAGTSIIYRRELPLGETFTLHTRLSAFDERWGYWEQDFVRQDGQPAARLLARFAVRKGGKTRPLAEIFDAAPHPVTSPPMTPELDLWVEGMKEGLESLKTSSAEMSAPTTAPR